MRKADRLEWASCVNQQMEDLDLHGDRLIVMAGLAYRDTLMPFLHARFSRIEVPMIGKKIGERLQWLSTN
jgi:hypothetical protein